MASSSMTALINSIHQDISRIANKIAHGVATVALEDLREAHSQIMDDYYDGYDPITGSYPFQYPDKQTGESRIGYAHGYVRSGNLANSFIADGVFGAGKHSFVAKTHAGADNMSDYVNSSGRTFPAAGVFELVWNQANRGMPSGYRGHIGTFSINASPLGVSIGGSPDNAMAEFVDRWGATRGGEVADQIAHSI